MEQLLYLYERVALSLCLFLRLMLAQLLWVANCLVLVASRLLDPLWQRYTGSSQQLDHTWCWLGTIIKILLGKLGIDVSFFGVWVIVADIGHHTAA